MRGSGDTEIDEQVVLVGDGGLVRHCTVGTSGTKFPTANWVTGGSPFGTDNIHFCAYDESDQRWGASANHLTNDFGAAVITYSSSTNGTTWSSAINTGARNTFADADAGKGGLAMGNGISVVCGRAMVFGSLTGRVYSQNGGAFTNATQQTGITGVMFVEGFFITAAGNSIQHFRKRTQTGILLTKSNGNNTFFQTAYIDDFYEDDDFGQAVL